MPARAFPVLYARDVERTAAFYGRLGFEERFRLPAEGEAGYIGLRRGESELAVTTVESPRQLIGVGSAPSRASSFSPTSRTSTSASRSCAGPG